MAARGAAGLAMALCSMAVLANGYGESGSWQFQTQQDKVGKASIADMIEKKKAGYYDSFKSVYNYNTYIDKQVNCSLTAATTGNTGTNATSASTSSPNVSNSGSTNSNLGANSATSGLSQAGLNGVLVPNAGSSPTGSLSSGQSNTGNLDSSVSGSNTTAATGAVSSNGGTTDQVLNSQQSNSGMLASTITASTACSGPLN